MTELIVIAIAAMARGRAVINVSLTVYRVLDSFMYFSVHEYID